MAKIYTINNKILTVNNKWGEMYEEPTPTPPGPSFDEVTIGTQTWMSKNLAIDDGGEGITIKENVTANGVNFGTQYYYTWAAAVRVANSINGWHLPTKAEWETLVSYAGGSNSALNKLRSTTGWYNNSNGTDDYGFTGLPTGYIYQGTGPNDRGNQAWWWSSTEDSDTSKAYYTYIGFDVIFQTWGLYTSYTVDKSQAPISIRLIKDT